MATHLKHASRLLQQMPLELSAEDKVHLSAEEQGEYDGLMHERKKIHGKIRRIQMQAIFRRFLTPEQQARFVELEREEAEITARLTNVPKDGPLDSTGELRGDWVPRPGQAEPDLARLRKIGHEFNDLVAAAYLRAVVHGVPVKGSVNQDNRLSA